MKHETKIHAEARYFAVKLGLNGTSKERTYNHVFTKYLIFLKINTRVVLIRHGGTFIRHLRVVDTTSGLPPLPGECHRR